MDSALQSPVHRTTNDKPVAPRSTPYKNQAFKLLKKEYPLLSVQVIKKTFEFHNNDFTSAFRTLHEIEQIALESGEERVRQRFAYLGREGKICIKYRRNETRFLVRNETLLSELDEIPEMNQKQSRNDSPEPRDEDDDEVEFIEVKRSNSDSFTLECACCFGDVSFENMVQCTEAHLFCCDCLQHHVQEQIHEKNSTRFACLDSSGSRACPGFFDRVQLDKLSTDLQTLVDKKVAFQEVKNAGIGHECPRCSYIGADNPEAVVLQCCECSFIFCKLCYESFDIHKDKSCQKVAEEKEESRRSNAVNTVSEQMTAAVVRNCPKCSLACIKEEGCNKMTCPNMNCPVAGSKTRTKFCFLCREEIVPEVGYDHFCRTPHCTHDSCGKCILFTNTIEQDRVAREEAAKNEISKLDANSAAAAFKLLSLSDDNPGEQPPFGEGANGARQIPVAANPHARPVALNDLRVIIREQAHLGIAEIQAEREQRLRALQAQREAHLRAFALQAEREARERLLAVLAEREARARAIVLQAEREQREQREIALQAEREQREIALQAEREQREIALQAEREQREIALQAEREQRDRAAQAERERAAQAERDRVAQAEREQRDRAAQAEREQRDRATQENAPLQPAQFGTQWQAFHRQTFQYERQRVAEEAERARRAQRERERLRRIRLERQRQREIERIQRQARTARAENAHRFELLQEQLERENLRATDPVDVVAPTGGDHETGPAALTSVVNDNVARLNSGAPMSSANQAPGAHRPQTDNRYQGTDPSVHQNLVTGTIYRAWQSMFARAVGTADMNRQDPRNVSANSAGNPNDGPRANGGAGRRSP